MIFTFLHRTLLIALSVAACWWLVMSFGAWPALGLWVVLTAVGSLVGAELLRTSPIGRVNWKNRIAGLLIPWGYRLSRGRLWAIGVVSWLVWVLIGAATFLLMNRGAAASEAESGTSPIWFALLLVAWIVDGGAFLSGLGTLVTNFAPGSQSGRSLLKVLAGVVAIVGISVVLLLIGKTELALLVAGGPPLVLGLLYGLFIGVMLTVGRNARWN